jgi:exonuclease SbcD
VAVKVLHTADWHVGQGVRGRSRADEHRAVLDEIVGIAAKEAVDLVLVTGDQFHSGAPSPESEAIVYRALMKLAATVPHVHVLAGNHDNPNRLRALTPILEVTNITAVSHPMPPDEGGVQRIESRSGETAVIASVPFLSKRTIVRADDIMSLEASDHEGKYRDRYRKIVQVLTRDFSGETVNLIAAHATVLGGATSGGERQSQSIFDYVIPGSVFPETAHYVALGHLHGTQRIDAGAPAWYPGSPLQMDFGDKSPQKHVLMVEAVPGRPAHIRQIPLESGRRMITWTGSLEQLQSAVEGFEDAFVRVRLTDAHRPGLADEARAICPNAVDVALTPSDHQKKDVVEESDIRGSPMDLFQEFLAERDIDDDGLTKLFDELLEHCLAADTD